MCRRNEQYRKDVRKNEQKHLKTYSTLQRGEPRESQRNSKRIPYRVPRFPRKPCRGPGEARGGQESIAQEAVGARSAVLDARDGHGEPSRLQLRFKLAGADTAALACWLYKFGCQTVVVKVRCARVFQCV